MFTRWMGTFALGIAALAIGSSLSIGAGAWSLSGRRTSPAYDVLIRGGTLYDGRGGPGVRADLGIRDDRIASIGDLRDQTAARSVDARGLAVAPGFINMLSWSTESLLVDGRAVSAVRQGVTTEIMGEGSSMGPLTPAMKARLIESQQHLRYDVTWTSLSEYLAELTRRGVSLNVASFIGAATIREHVIGLEDKPATPAQLDAMRELVRREMEAGALGIGSSLIYAPGAYASTEELIELCRVAARYDGSYISHIRSEGRRLIEGIDELIRISREAGLPAEIYHLKAAGRENWPKMETALERIEEARRTGLAISADMYLYTAGATGLDATVAPSALDGGFTSLLERLARPEERLAIASAMRTASDAWENLYLAAGSADRVLLVGFRTPALRPLIGKTLAEIAASRNRDPVDTILDLMIEDGASPAAVYFMMSEDNLRKQLLRPWVTIGSDAAAMAAEGVFLQASTHPRAYGNFARLLGKYVRDEKLLSIEDAIRRMTSLPAKNLGLRDRGELRPGAFADITVFDPTAIADRATFDRPHQYSVGVQHVFVNGAQVLENGEHTGAKPGRALRRGKR
jgi:N-acyl-D-aspartate/D-glutamate deacylase